MDQPPPRIHLDRYDQSWYSRGRSVFVVMLWELVQMVLIHGSLHPMYAWRRFWYRVFGARIGAHVLIRRTVICNYPWNVTIGEHSWIGDGATLYALESITIGSHVVISQQAYLCSGSHDHRDPAFGLVVKPITVEHGAWIALGALIMPGVRVGEGAVIAARAVLTRDAAPWTLHRGAPAVAVGPRELRGAATPVPAPAG
jgi:putative colanic acid biosynthesis acetyltransferase WcaF